MTGGALVDQIMRILIQEPTVTREDALVWLQRGADDVSGRVLLPALETVAEVQAEPDDNRVLLPAGYQRGLFRAERPDGRRLIVLNARDRLRRLYSDRQGRGIEAVAAAPPFLFYGPRPAEREKLAIFYYRRPEIAEAGEVDFLPADHARLLVHYGAWQGFSLIEQGLQIQKLDTQYHKREYLEGLEELRLFVREGESLPVPPLARCAW